MSYIGVHNHTDIGSNHEFRDSINKVKDLINYAHSLGHKGICITDHESLSAHFKALDYYESKMGEDDWKDFKIGLGNEIYLCPEFITAENIGNNFYPHFILIALDAFGHKGLRELSTKAWTENCFYSKWNRVPTYYNDLAEMLDVYRGHIIGSTACLGSSINRQLLQYKENPSEDIIVRIRQWLAFMVDIFGEENFFIELQPNPSEEQIFCNQKLLEFAQEYNLPYIISTDAHYLKKEDRAIHKAYITANKEDDREVDYFYQTTYVMSEEEIHSYMDEYLGYDIVQKGIDNTMLIYDRLEYYSMKKDLEIPFLPLDRTEPDKELIDKYSKHIPLLREFAESEYESDRHMIREMLKGIEKDEVYQTERGYNATNECLSYIKQSSEKMGVRWSAYLDQMADYINIIWDCGSVVAVGRGSVIGFCIANQMGITQINPLRENTATFPWRFLNPERASILDIDTDVNPIFRDKIINRFKEIYGADKVSKVLTYSTEKSRSAILTAGRGIGLDNDLTSYIASLVVFDRGNPRSLKTMYYGDEDNKPVQEFVNEMNDHPDLWETAQKLEGLCSGIGSHAGGVIICDKSLIDTCALIRTKSGDVITQYDLHEDEAMSLIKIDLLATNAVSKIQECLKLLLDKSKIEWQGSFRNTYEKYIGVYNLERYAEDMWKLLWEHKVISAFQMEKESGKQALALVKPHSVDDLAVLNSVIRLMAQEKGAETPLNKFARFHEDINEWYQEMRDYGLTEEEQEILKPILKTSFGICESQEKFMQLVQLPECGGFSLSWSDKLRKSVAKKNPKEFENLTKEFFEITKQKGCSPAFCNYVWNVLVSVSRGYSFNSSHTLAYSMILLQELNLNYRWNPIYWQTANLIVDSGSLDDNSNDSTDYGKIGIAIANIKKENVNIEIPLINEAGFGFEPDENNNRIIFGLKAINGINTEVSQAIIQNRPYSSMEDFANKLLDTGIIKNAQMIKLIKAGCFTELHSPNKEITMEWYLRNYKYNPLKKLTLSQLSALREKKLIPEAFDKCVKILILKDYILDDEGFYSNYIDPDKKPLKRGYHDRYYILDDNSQPIFKDYFSEECIVGVQGEYYLVSEKQIDKEAKAFIEPFREWMNSADAINRYNLSCFLDVWEQYASGSKAHWSMESLTYYDEEHELENVNESLYGIVNYFELPEEPVAYDWYARWINGERKIFPKYNISRIAGTVINADNNHHMVSLLTKYGLVNVKMNKGHYAFYNKQISQIDEDNNNKKHKIEDSWLKRGQMIIVSGIRMGDTFYPRIYNDTIYKHTISLIKEVNKDGTLLLQNERTKI